MRAPHLGTNLWIVWTSRCSRDRGVHPRHPLTRSEVPTSRGPLWSPLGPPSAAQPVNPVQDNAGSAASGGRPAGAAAGLVPVRMIGTRSCSVGWRPGWSPTAAGRTGYRPGWCSAGGRSWWAPISPSTPSRCRSTRASCWSAPAPRPGPPNCGCCNVNSWPGSPRESAPVWSPACGSRAQPHPAGCTAPAMSAAAAPGTPTVRTRCGMSLTACCRWGQVELSSDTRSCGLPR